MKLKNSTDFSDAFLRRMVSWCCRELELPVSYIREAQFRNRQSSYSGHAWPYERRICVSVGTHRRIERQVDHAERPTHTTRFCEVREPGKPVIYREFVPDPLPLEKRIDFLVRVTAHECAHLMLSRFGRSMPKDAQKPHGRRKLVHGGSEQQTEWHEKKLMALFEANRDALLAAWNEPVAERAKTTIPISEKRQAKVLSDLERWNRKLKLAQTKIRKLKKRAAYYERKAACKQPQE